MKRSHERWSADPRPISIEKNFIPNADGSVLYRCGHTHVLCTASIEERVPPFLMGQNKGWLTASYTMLPASTHTRNSRERSLKSARSTEIERLIGRSLRMALDRSKMPGLTLHIDCDVMNADGGTRTACISGGFVALSLAVAKLLEKKILRTNPIVHQIGAISLGIKRDAVLLDLDYEEDASADVDMNLVGTKEGLVVEAQASAEGAPFAHESLLSMLALGKRGLAHVFEAQDLALKDLTPKDA